VSLFTYRAGVLFRNLVQRNSSYSFIPHQRKMSGDSRAQKIGTHNGTFHCDEVLACFMLKQLSHYKDAEIVRSV